MSNTGMESTAPSSSPKYRQPTTGLIVLLGALSAFSPLAIDMYLPAFPEIERDLTAPAGTVPLTLSFFLAGLAVGQFVVGSLFLSTLNP